MSIHACVHKCGPMSIASVAWSGAAWCGDSFGVAVVAVVVVVAVMAVMWRSWFCVHPCVAPVHLSLSLPASVALHGVYFCWLLQVHIKQSEMPPHRL